MKNADDNTDRDCGGGGNRLQCHLFNIRRLKAYLFKTMTDPCTNLWSKR